MAVERTENLRQKEALCEQVEALAESTDWIRTAETIKALQAQWKTIGPVTPGHEKAIWERFRAACDRFFTRRKNDLTERKTVWTANLQKKEAICAQIEALAETTDWDQAIAEVKRLQAEWRQVGPVKRNRVGRAAAAVPVGVRAVLRPLRPPQRPRSRRSSSRRASSCAPSSRPLTPPEGAEPIGADALAKQALALKRQWDQSPAARAHAEPLRSGSPRR